MKLNRGRFALILLLTGGMALAQQPPEAPGISPPAPPPPAGRPYPAEAPPPPRGLMDVGGTIPKWPKSWA